MESLRPDLTREQALKVLETVYDNHSADIGTNWDTLSHWANELFGPYQEKNDD